MTLSGDELEYFVTGGCVALATALHRLTGWEIQAVIEQAAGPYPPWVGHAWCVDPASGNCVDIDGSYLPALNGWVRSDNTLMTGLSEVQLREVTTAGAGVNWDPDSWESAVLAALPIARNYVLPLVASA